MEMSATVWWMPRTSNGDKRSRQTTLQVWRAVCAETCKHRFGEGWLETCRKVTRWPPTLLTRGRVAGNAGIIRTISTVPTFLLVVELYPFSLCFRVFVV